MRVRDLSLWLLVSVALVVGALPLQVCMPHDGEPASVQVAGCHGHGHDHDSDGGVPPRPREDGSCCDDVPLDRSTPGAPIAVPPCAAEGAASWTASAPVVKAAPGRVAAPVLAPRERGLIVLLR